MNTDPREKAKNDCKKDLMNNSVFGKTMENVRKLRDIKLLTEKRRNYLVSESNYHTKMFFTEHLLAKEKKMKILMNKPVYLGLSLPELKH